MLRILFADSGFRIPASLILTVLCCSATSAQITGFATPDLLTDGTADYQLARNPADAAAFDASGHLHLVYWSGGESGASPDDPSFVYHRSWTRSGGWTAQQSIDNSTTDRGSGPEHVGGRHPSLTIAPDGTVWAAWHDHRHGSAPGNWIDNIEIYADRLPAGGAWSSTDIRITETNNPGNPGDNGYMPNIEALPDGRLAVLWYDFTTGAGNEPDLYLQLSDTAGNFTTSTPMSDLRRTNGQALGTPRDFTVPDLAVSSTGDLLATWTSGTGPAEPAFFAEIPAAPALLAEGAITQLAPQTAAFFDPPKIAIAPDDTVHVLYTDRSASPDRTLRLRTQAPGASAFSEFVLQDAPGTRHEQGTLAIGADGIVHLAYVETTGSARTVQYLALDAATETRLQEWEVTPAQPADWTRPVVVLDAVDRPHVILESDPPAGNGALYHVQPEFATAAKEWMEYE